MLGRRAAEHAAIDTEARECATWDARRGTGDGGFGGTGDRTTYLVVKRGPEGRLGNCLDSEELVRKRAVLRVVLKVFT